MPLSQWPSPHQFLPHGDIPLEGHILDSVAKLLKLVGSADSLHAQLGCVARFVEQFSAGVRCSIMLCDTTKRTLQHGAAPNLPDDYSAAIDGIPIGEGQGSCGTAAARYAPVIVADIQASSLWQDYRELAQAHGLAGCWSTPIMEKDGELLGTFAMYSTEPHEPTWSEIMVLRVAGPLTAAVIHRHRDAQRLRDSEERFRSAFYLAAVGKALISREGHWLRVNQAQCQLLGYSADELLHMNFQACVHPDDWAHDVRAAAEMIDGVRSHYESEQRLYNKSGETVWVSMSMSLVRNADGEPRYFIAQMQDISERKRLENVLRELTTAEQRRLGRELHDGLGQELTGLAFLADAFATKARRASSPLAKDAAALSSIARHAVATCRNIVRGVSPLTESRGGLIGGIRRLTQRAATFCGARIDLTVIKQARIKLTWDARNQLFRITQEALNNAMAHANARHIDVHMVIKHRSIRIEVRDDGSGLPAKPGRRGGLGLETMRYRATAIHAEFAIATPSSGGTVVSCECPQPAESPPSDTDAITEKPPAESGKAPRSRRAPTIPKESARKARGKRK